MTVLFMAAGFALSAALPPLPERCAPDPKTLPQNAGFVKVEWSEKSGEKWTVEGLADRESGRPMAKDTVFAIASNTKPITSVLALTLVEEGVIDLDDPVSKYLPAFADIKVKGRPPKRPLTLRHLLTHLSGLPYGVAAEGRKKDMTSYREKVELTVKQGLSRDPGETYQYCGLGFQIMGAVIEKVTGRKVTDLMKERIFDPLEMTETTFYPDEAMLARAAVPYYYPPKGGQPLRYDFDNLYTPPLGNPARTAQLSGGLFSTAGDYLKFSQMIALKGIGANGKRILSEKTFNDYLLTRQTPPGSKLDRSFDIAFNQDHTGGGKGGLFATGASWNWAKKSCVITFRAKSPYAPKGVESKIDATGFDGKKTVFVISDVQVADGTASCLVGNNDDRHGAATVKLVVNGKVIGGKRVELAIGQSKRVTFACAAKPGDKAAFTAAPLKVLMIGNSFSICVLEQMPKVCADLGLELDLCSLFIGGCSLARHMQNVNNPTGKPYRVTWNYASLANQTKAPFASLLVDGAKKRQYANIPEMLTADRWDIVTIQQCSGESWIKRKYHPSGDELVTTVRKLAPQAEIVVQETWSYTPWDKRLTKSWKIDQNEMYARLREAYAEFAGSYGFRVIPMGTAVQDWRKRLPVKYTENSFGGDVCGSAKFIRQADDTYRPKGDVFHLNGRGHYLQALLWTAKLFGADVTNCSFRPAEVNEAEAALMKQIVTELVR